MPQPREFTRLYAKRDHTGACRSAGAAHPAVGQGLIFDLLIDGDRAAADDAVREFSRMIQKELAAP